MSNISGDEASLSPGEEVQYQENQQQQQQYNYLHGSSSRPSHNNASNDDHYQHHLQSTKKKRNLPGTPDPNAEVIALSPTTMMATNRFVCKICNKGFQRDQNLQLHGKGHNPPWKLELSGNVEKIHVLYY